MKALILSGGFGVRLREIIHGRPKHLIPINGQPFLRHLIKMLKKRNINEVILAVGYLAPRIIDEFTQDDEGIKIKFSEANRPLGTAGSLKKAEKYFNDDFIVINGDTYLDIDYSKLLSEHKKSQALITIVATAKHKNKGGIILAKNNNVIKFISDPQAKTPVNSFRNAGIYVMSPKIFKYIPQYYRVSLEKNTIPKLLTNKKLIKLFPVNQEFIDIGSPEEHQKAIKKLE